MNDTEGEREIRGVEELTTNSGPVAMFLPNLGGGGMERVTVNLLQGLTDRRIVAELVLARAEGPLLAQVPQGVRVVDLRASRVLMAIVPLARYLRAVRPAVVLSATSHGNICALLSRRLSCVRTRVIVALHSVFAQQVSEIPPWKWRIMFRLMRRCYRWADSIVAVSCGLAENTARMTGVPRARFRVIYNPVIDSQLFVKAREPLDHPWFRANQPKVVLSVGNLRPVKDHATLIQAFAVLRRHLTARLMVLGEGPERPLLETLVREKGLADDVLLPGYVKNPYAFMARAGALVLPSKYEALPTVLVEAMALHVPVVSVDCDFGPREILAGGEYGILAPPGDVAALAEAMQEALANPQRKLPERALSPFTMDFAVNEYLKLFTEVTGQGLRS